MAKKNTPKKAVKKAQQAQDMMVQAALQAEMMQQGAPIDPEIQSQQIDMQVPTVNPYGRMGAMPPNQYNLDNSVSGYIGVQPVYNPEA
jgi:hypothetical protein